MAVTSSPYDVFLISALMPGMDLSSDTLKFALVTSGYTPDTANHVTYTNISGSEASGSGYTAGGQALTGVNVGYANSHVAWTANSLTWAGLSTTFRYAVLYDDTTSPYKYLIGYVDFGTDQVYVNQDFTLTFTNGFLALVKGTA